MLSSPNYLFSSIPGDRMKSRATQDAEQNPQVSARQ
jgi:hypothetical protein